MSRTYRRKNAKKLYFSRIRFAPEPSFWAWSGDLHYRYMNEWFDHYPTEKEMARTKALFHSDAGTTSFKEPGPYWFRRMYETRPSRQKNKRELQRYVKNPEYEPMCFEKGKLDYWT